MGTIPDQSEQNVLEQTILALLKNLTEPNANRLKVSIRILMSGDIPNYEAIVAKDVQQELKDLKNLIQNPAQVAPLSCASKTGKQAVLEHIRAFTFKNLNILDERISILPNAYTAAKTIQEGERLKSVVHSSALKNVLTAAHFQNNIAKKLSAQGFEGEKLNTLVQNAAESMVKLHTAVAEGDFLTVIQTLNIQGVDVNLPNSDGLPLLQLAVREGHQKIVALLLKEPGIDVNQVSINGWTALHFAARLGHTDMVKMLLAAPGIDVNQANSDGWTALDWAAWQGYLRVVDLLLTNNQIEVNKRDASLGTALHWAARNGQADVISILLAVPNIEVNALDIDKKTPLHYAVAFDHPSATAALLTSSYVQVNLQDIDGLSPLHWAARNGSIELVGLLKEIPNLRYDLKDHNDMIPADWAKHNQYFDLIPLLLPNKMKLPSYFQIYWHKLKQAFLQAWRRGSAQ